MIFHLPGMLNYTAPGLIAATRRRRGKRDGFAPAKR